MRVQVAKQHIRNGRRNSTVACPIALAILDLYPNSTLIVVTGEIIAVKIDGWWSECNHLSDEVKTFISRFDHGVKVKPDTLDIDLKPRQYRCVL